MNSPGPYSAFTDAVMLPKVIQLQANLYGASFFLLKLLPARFILDRAQDDGRLKPGAVVIETTSGTFGLALTLLCNRRGYRFIMVSDPGIDDSLRRRLVDLGTCVEIVRMPAVQGGIQRARLDRVAELRAEYPDSFWPAQYDNLHNRGAYAPLAELLVEMVGAFDCLIGPVGSGGSMCGTSYYLRMLFPELRAIGVDTFGSVLFGQSDQKRLLRGLGNSIMPQNLDHTTFDEVHWVSAAEAFHATRELHQKHQLFMGGTSGAAHLVARWWATQHPNAIAICLLPDEGYRYVDTIYHDEWLRANNLRLAQVPPEPRCIDHPAEAGPTWSYIHWDRRRYESVLGHHCV